MTLTFIAFFVALAFCGLLLAVCYKTAPLVEDPGEVEERLVRRAQLLPDDTRTLVVTRSEWKSLQYNSPRPVTYLIIQGRRYGLRVAQRGEHVVYG